MDRCPCISARHGVSMVALCAYAGIQAQAFFGHSATYLARAAHNGNGLAFAIVSVWLCLALLGLYWTVVGYRATRTHVDPLSGGSVAYSAGVISLCWWLLQEELTPAPAALPEEAMFIEISRALTIAWLAGNVINLYLQLRGLFPNKLPLRQPAGPRRASDSVLHEMHTMIASQAAEIHRLTEERNRLAYDLGRKPQSSGDVEAVLQFPGVARAVLATLHPDKFISAAEKQLATVRFQTASAVLEKLGVR